MDEPDAVLTLNVLARLVDDTKMALPALERVEEVGKGIELKDGPDDEPGGGGDDGRGLEDSDWGGCSGEDRFDYESATWQD